MLLACIFCDMRSWSLGYNWVGSNSCICIVQRSTTDSHIYDLGLLNSTWLTSDTRPIFQSPGAWQAHISTGPLLTDSSTIKTTNSYFFGAKTSQLPNTPKETWEWKETPTLRVLTQYQHPQGPRSLVNQGESPQSTNCDLKQTANNDKRPKHHNGRNHRRRWHQIKDFSSLRKLARKRQPSIERPIGSHDLFESTRQNLILSSVDRHSNSTRFESNNYSSAQVSFEDIATGKESQISRVVSQAC